MQEIRFATIGAGFMGSLLTRVGCSFPYAVCVAVADIDVQRARNLAEPLGANSYGDVEELFAKERPNAVIVATPEALHLDAVLASASRGCDVFVEKPVALKLEDADAMIRGTDNAGVMLMVGHILRFESCYAQLHSAVAGGSAGRILSIYARRLAGIGEAKRLGGRVSPLSYIAVHDFDQMLWCHPGSVKSVSAKAIRGRVYEQFGTYDLAWVTVEFADGAIGVEEVGWCLPESWADWKGPEGWGGFGDVRMSVVGTEAALNLDFTPMGLYAVDSAGWKLPDTRHWPLLDGRPAGAVRLEMEHFFSCVATGENPSVTGIDGRRALEIVLAAERSIATGGPVDLPL